MAIVCLDLFIDILSVELKVINIEGNFLFDIVIYWDFFGFMLGIGIEREKIGDIIVLGEWGV